MDLPTRYKRKPKHSTGIIERHIQALRDHERAMALQAASQPHKPVGELDDGYDEFLATSPNSPDYLEVKNGEADMPGYGEYDDER